MARMHYLPGTLAILEDTKAIELDVGKALKQIGNLLDSMDIQAGDELTSKERDACLINIQLMLDAIVLG